MSIARADTLEQRTAILRGLNARNRLVGILRVGVPVLGAIVLVALVLQLYVANLARQFGVSGISIDRNNLIVQTPSYSGTGADGTRYTMGAAEAKTAIDHPDAIALTTATLGLSPPKGGGYKVTAADAQLTMSTQRLAIPGTANVTGDDGMRGTLQNVEADMLHRNLVAHGLVNLVFANGATIDANAMTYNSKTRVWTFDHATLVLPDAPKADAAKAAAPAPATAAGTSP